MNIGEAAKISGLSSKMIRNYEDIGLISSPLRTSAGYRVYSEHDIESLRFVKRARDLGFTIEDIRMLLGLWKDKSRASSAVKELALKHVALLEQKMAELQSMTDTLKHLAHHCQGNNRPDCPILADLAGEAKHHCH